MNLAQVKTYVSGVLKGWFSNKPTLDKLSESDDGNLLFDGKETTSISKETDNALINKSDGLYVPTTDLTNYATKTYVDDKEVKVSEKSGNILVEKEDGLYVPNSGNGTESSNVSNTVTVNSTIWGSKVSWSINTTKVNQNYNLGTNKWSIESNKITSLATTTLKYCNGVHSNLINFNDINTIKIYYKSNNEDYIAEIDVKDINTEAYIVLSAECRTSVTADFTIYISSSLTNYGDFSLASKEIGNKGITVYNIDIFSENSMNQYVCIDSYSEEEQVVGKWLDGRPIYRKTIPCTIPETATDGNFVESTIKVDDNVLRIIQCNGHLGAQHLLYITDKGYQLKTYWSNVNGTITIRNNNTAFNNKEGYIIVEYTKTTDAENSFTPDMILNIAKKEYTDLNAIEINGQSTGFLHTGVFVDSLTNPRISGEISIKSYAQYFHIGLFCYYSENHDCFRIILSNDKFLVYNLTKAGSGAMTISKSVPLRKKFSFELGNGYLVIDGEKTTFSQSKSGTHYNSEFVLSSNSNDNLLMYHSLQLWDGDTLVRNYKPKLNSNNQIGFYDTVTKTFIPLETSYIFRGVI